MHDKAKFSEVIFIILLAKRASAKLSIQRYLG